MMIYAKNEMRCDENTSLEMRSEDMQKSEMSRVTRRQKRYPRRIIAEKKDFEEEKRKEEKRLFERLEGGKKRAGKK
jgi:hypothetical protein